MGHCLRSLIWLINLTSRIGKQWNNNNGTSTTWRHELNRPISELVIAYRQVAAKGLLRVDVVFVLRRLAVMCLLPNYTLHGCLIISYHHKLASAPPVSQKSEVKPRNQAESLSHRLQIYFDSHGRCAAA